MSFFSKFPTRPYVIPGMSTGVRQVVDITKRVVLRSYAKENQSLFIKYKMKAHESYESIAHKMYGSAQYHWILMLLNDVIDPFSDMPVDQVTFAARTKKNYPGYALYFAPLEFDGNFTPGETVRAAEASTDALTGNRVLTYNTYTGVVTSWDPTYRELVVESETNTTVLDPDADMIIVGLTSGATGTLKRRTEHRYAVHHFEDSQTGEILSPLPSPLDVDQSSPLTSYVESSESAGINIITNDEYEERRNDSNREINVMRPEHVAQIESEISQIFRG